VAGGPNLKKPLGLIFAEIRKRVAFRLLCQHFAARTEATETSDVATAGEIE
jgi:hypothetical protein